MKESNKTPNKTIRAIISGELHALVTPPHSIASKKQIVEAIIVIVPIKSIWRNFSLRVALAGFAAAGALNSKRITAAEVIPIGRLM
jgi:hypothetical protein